MSGLTGVLHLATQSLFANSTSIEITGHNIANTDTPGYSRQEATLQPYAAVNIGGLWLGRGVQVTGIENTEDRFINFQIFRNSSLLGSLDARLRSAEPLQEIFNESIDEGLSNSINDFFEAIGDLTSNPEGQPERTALRGKAEALITNFHLVSDRIEDIARGADSEISFILSDVNLVAEQIADLNGKIRSIEASGQSANDFRTQRSQLMEELAGYIDYNYFEDESGMVTIMVGNGKPLVEGTNYGSLKGFSNPANNNFQDIYFQDINGNQFDITSHIESGALGGSLEIRDELISDMQDRLDNMAYTLVTEFNNVHQGGWTLNNTTGQDFFTFLAGPNDAATQISLDSAIETDVNNIAAGATNSSGDNQNALALAELHDALLFNGGTWTFQDEFSSMVADVGIQALNIERGYDHQEAILTQVKNTRESIAGVSIEEEMSNLIKFQQSYQASARLFNTVSELLETLISLR